MIDLDRKILPSLRENNPIIAYALNHAYEIVDHRTGLVGGEKNYLLIALRGLLNQYYELTRISNQSAVLALPTLEFLKTNISEVLYYLLCDDQTTMAHLINAGFIKDQETVLKLLLNIQPESEQETTLTFPLIGITGKIGSGKETLSTYLAKCFKFNSIALSDRLREVALSRVDGSSSQLPFEREDLRIINDIFKPNCGNEVFVRWTLWQLARITHRYPIPGAIIDGFRSKDEAQYFINQGGVLLFVDTDLDIRFERSRQRARTDGDLSYETFLAGDAKEAKWIDPIIPLAAVIIQNNGSLEQLYAEGNKFFETTKLQSGT